MNRKVIKVLVDTDTAFVVLCDDGTAWAWIFDEAAWELCAEDSGYPSAPIPQLELDYNV